MPVEQQNTTFIAPLPFATPKIKAEWEARQASRYRQAAPPREAVAFWSDKRFMRVAHDHRRDFRPIVEQSLWVAGTFVRVPDDREGIGRGILGSPTMVSPTVVIASQPERERGLSGRRREGMI